MYLKGEKKRASTFITASFLFILIILETSCASYHNTTYFRNIPDSLSGPEQLSLANYTEPKIQPGDLLYISIQTLDPQSTAAISGTNTSTGFSAQAASTLTPTTTSAPTYLVNKTGNVELPLVGSIDVGDLTTTEAREAIRKKSAVYFKNPVINIRFANFNITVLGEVNRPAQYTVPSERVTLLDAIGMAGDLTIYGKRENVLLIREENGKKKAVRFNLNSSDLMTSPYFYLRQNDVIYVEPNKAKVASNDYVRDRNIGYAITIASSLISIGIILLTRL